jgi:hypothetical protein
VIAAVEHKRMAAGSRNSRVTVTALSADGRGVRGPAESSVLDACSQQPHAPGGLERAVDAPRSARPSEIAFGSLSAVCESLADAARATLAPDATALEPDRLQQLRRPLFIVDQGLRLTASACDLGREVVASIQGHR